MSSYIVKCKKCKSVDLFLDNLEVQTDNLQCNKCGEWFEANNNIYELDLKNILKKLDEITEELNYNFENMDKYEYDLTLSDVHSLKKYIENKIIYIKTLF